MLYLVVETSVILLAAAVVFFLLGAYYQRHFAAKSAEQEESTGAWNVAPKEDEEKEWLRRRLAELEGRLAALATKESPPSDVAGALAPALYDFESRLQALIENKFEAIENRLGDVEAAATARPEAVPSPVRPAGPDAATLNALAAVERRLTEAMANHFATMPAPARTEISTPTFVPAPVSDEHLATVVERFAQELASVESRLTATFIDQLSTQTAHRDVSVDIRNLEETVRRLESRLAQRIDAPAEPMTMAPIEESLELQNLENFGAATERGALVEPSSAQAPDPSTELRALADAFARLEHQVATMNDAMSRLEVRTAMTPPAPETGTDVRALADAFSRLERHVATMNDAMSRLEVQTAMTPVAPPPAPETGTDVRALADAFGRLERTVATFPDRPMNASVNFDELNGRFDRIEHYLAQQATPDLAPMYGMLQSLHQRIDAMEFRSVMPPAGNANGGYPNDGSSAGPTLWTAEPEPATATTPEAATAPIAVAPAPAPAPDLTPLAEAIAATTKELEAIASTMQAIEAGTHARFDAIERQIIGAAKSSAKPNVDDDRLERVERRLEEMSVRAEQTATAFEQIATSQSMDQLGEEFRDNAANLERRTVALEVELVRHRELLKKMIETAAPVTAPDPNADPAVIALESAKQELGARIDAMQAAIERHVALAATADDSKGLEEKLDGIERRLADHLSRTAAQSKTDAAPTIDAMRMDLAGLRVALLQSVASNRPPLAELHGIRTEIERLRETMKDVGKDGAELTAREAELALRVSELERRASEREHEFEARERRLDDEYQDRVVALERELESLEQKLEREEREDAKTSEYELRSQRLEERERRLEEREAAMSDRLAVLERELSESRDSSPEVDALRDRLAAAEAALAKASHDRHEEEVRRELERRMDERLSETQRDSRELRDELQHITTMLREAPEPPPPPPPTPAEPPASKEVLARIDKLEDLLWETTAEARKLAATRSEAPSAPSEDVKRLESSLEATVETLKGLLATSAESLKASVTSLEAAMAAKEARQVQELESRFRELRATLEAELARRDSRGASESQQAREALAERLEQWRVQFAHQLERQASEVKEAERALADRFDLKLEKSLESVTESIHRELSPRFETLQMAMRFGGPGAPVVMAPESDARALSRLEDRLRDIERSLHTARPATGDLQDEARQALERERRQIAEELREAERRSREKIRRLERELDEARNARSTATETTTDYREEDMPRGRYGMSAGYNDPTRILEELEQRLTETEERFEKLSKDAANVRALEAQLRTEREAREELEDRLREVEHRERERQSSLETAMERTRSDQSRQVLELRSDFRRELDDRLRDTEERISRRAVPMMPPQPAYPMAGFGMGGGDPYTMGAMNELERRVRDALEGLRTREAALTTALNELRELRDGGPRGLQDAVDEAVQEAIESLERRVEAMRDEAQLSEPITAALRGFRERLESVEKSVDDLANDDSSPLLQKLEDRIRELESKERDQTTGLYADIDDLRRSLATERRSLETKVDAKLNGLEMKAGGASPEELEKVRKEIEESNDRTQKQLLAMRDYVVKLDKAIRPLEERIGSFESQLGSRVDGGVTPEMFESLGERLTRLELVKPATNERIEAVTQEVNGAIESLRTVFGSALSRLDGMEQRVTAMTTQVDDALTSLKAHSEERIEDLVAHIDHLQEEMREEALERDNEGTPSGGIEPTELRRVEEEELKRFREVQERFERLEKSFGAKFEAVKHDLEANIHHSEERAHDDALSLSARTDERLQKMVGGLEKLVAEKENIIAELSERVKSLTDQVHQNPDDLTDIAGIGPKLKKKLKEEFGITTFKALATISSADLERLAGMLLFPDRIFREDWIGQARELHLRKYNELLAANEAEGEMRMRLAS